MQCIGSSWTFATEFQSCNDGNICAYCTYDILFVVKYGTVTMVFIYYIDWFDDIPSYLPTYIPIYTRTHIHTDWPTYLHTYIHTYMHACMHTYIHACIEQHKMYVYTIFNEDSEDLSIFINDVMAAFMPRSKIMQTSLYHWQRERLEVDTGTHGWQVIAAANHHLRQKEELA